MTYTFGGKEYAFTTPQGTINNIEQINCFIQRGTNYAYNNIVSGHVRIRRVDNAWTTLNRTLVWMQGMANVGVDYALYSLYPTRWKNFSRRVP